MSLYELNYFQARTDWRRREMQVQEMRRIGQHLDWDTVGTVLDIGCGTGEFLANHALRDRYGIETSEYATLVAESRGISFDLPSGGGWADLVVMRGVLQHLPNPREVFAQAHRYLKPGGVLAILATPNADSLVYRLHGTLPCLVPELNHWIPGTRSLTRVLAETGFHTPRFHYPYWGTPYAKPLRDLAMFALGRPAASPGNMLECFARA